MISKAASASAQNSSCFLCQFEHRSALRRQSEQVIQGDFVRLAENAAPARFWDSKKIRELGIVESTAFPLSVELTDDHALHDNEVRFGFGKARTIRMRFAFRKSADSTMRAPRCPASGLLH